MPAEDRASAAGISDGLLRLSVGVESRGRISGPISKPRYARREEPDVSRIRAEIRANAGRSMDRLVVVGARQHNLKNVSVSLAARQARRLHRPERLGQVVARLRHDLRRGAAPLRRVAQRLRAAVPRAAREARRRAHRGALARHRDRAARRSSKSPRSTVGTVTEIADYLRLLFARVGVPHCPNCGKRIEAQTVQQIVDRILALPEARASRVLAPICRARKGELKLEIERLRREGFVRARIDGSVVDLGDEIVLDRTKMHDLDVVVDRLVAERRPQGPPHRQRRARAQARRRAPARRSRGRGGAVLDERALRLHRLRHLAPADRAAHVLVQRPARRLPGVRRPRARATCVDPERVRRRRRAARCARAWSLAWGRRGMRRARDRDWRAPSTRSASSPDVAWGKLPEASSARPSSSASAGKRATKKPAYEGIAPQAYEGDRRRGSSSASRGEARRDQATTDPDAERRRRSPTTSSGASS